MSNDPLRQSRVDVQGRLIFLLDALELDLPSIDMTDLLESVHHMKPNYGRGR